MNIETKILKKKIIRYYNKMWHGSHNTFRLLNFYFNGESLKLEFENEFVSDSGYGLLGKYLRENDIDYKLFLRNEN